MVVRKMELGNRFTYNGLLMYCLSTKEKTNIQKKTIHNNGIRQNSSILT